MQEVAAVNGSAHVNIRDVELLRYLAAGRSTAQIAGAMAVSGNTVRTRVRRVQGKLSVGDRAGAVHEAVERGLI